MLSIELASNLTRNITYTIAIALVALVTKTIASITIATLLKKIQNRDGEATSALEQRAKTLSTLADNVANVLIFGTMIMMIMSQWGINIAPILTGAGILGLAVGFGTQTLVRDIVTGFFILFENLYNVGDNVKIAGSEGIITEMNLRTTVLTAEDGTKHIIPNSQIATIVKNKK